MDDHSGDGQPPLNAVSADDAVHRWAHGVDPLVVRRRRRCRRLLFGSAGAALIGGMAAGGAALASSPATAALSAQKLNLAAATSRAAPPFAGRPPGPGGRVTAVGGNSITITTRDGSSVSVTTNAATTYEVGRTSATASAVAVGDNVAIRLTSGSTSTAPIAAEVEILQPTISGMVTSVSGSTILVIDDQGFQRTITTNGSTTYTTGSQTTTASAVQVGTSIVASGSIDANKTDLDATKVAVVLPHTVGRVSAVSGTTITLTGPDGTTTVTTDGSTVFRSGGTSSNLAAVKVGSMVVASGTKASDGSLAASEVDVLANVAGRHPGARGGPGGPLGFGGGGPIAPGGLGL